MTVFISYNQKEIQFAKALKRALENHQVEVWLDNKMIGVGEDLKVKIKEAIDTVDYVISIISSHSIISEWFNFELSYALYREKKENKSIVIPLLIQRG